MTKQPPLFTPDPAPVIDLWISGTPRTQGSGDRMVYSRKVKCRVCQSTTIVPRATVGPYVDNSEKQLKDQHGNVTRKSGALTRWKANVKASAQVAMWEADAEMIVDAPVRLEVEFVLARPKSVKREWPHKDLDQSKMLRAVEDALEGVVYVNDAQICQEPLSKRYAVGDETPGVRLCWSEVK